MPVIGVVRLRGVNSLHAAAIVLFAGILSSRAAVYVGSTDVQVTLAALEGNLFPEYAGISGSAAMELTIENETIQYSSVTITLPSVTWSGVQTYTDPETLQAKSISFSITTQAATFGIQAGGAHSLTAVGGDGLAWNLAEFVTGSSFNLAGAYTLEGPAETVSGSFNKELVLSSRHSSGELFPAGAGSFTAVASHYYVFTFSSLPLFEDEVDGIDLDMVLGGWVSEINVRPSLGSTLTLTPVPEPSMASLAVVSGGIVLLLRRRRK